MPAKSKHYRGVTQAYKAFKRIILRSTSLLEAGIHGISGKTDELEEILTKFDDFRAPRGPAPADYSPNIKTKSAGSRKIAFSMDARSALFMKKALQMSVDHHKKLRFHLYALLVASVWGHLETYLVMLFGELFSRQPKMLKSGKTITFDEAVDNQGDILGHIAEKQLDTIGHFSLKEHLVYLKTSLGFNFSDTRQRKLSQYYLIRNIIAHNSGHVRPTLQPRLPDDIQIADGEMRITKEFLGRMLRDIQQCAQLIEKHVEKKFFQQDESTLPAKAARSASSSVR